MTGRFPVFSEPTDVESLSLDLSNKRGASVAIYVVRVSNPIINQEVMKIETEDRLLALGEAEYYSKRHGIAEVFDISSNTEVARFRYGVKESDQA